VQRLHSLEEAETQYLEILRKARPDLAEKVHRPKKAEMSSSKKVWHPKKSKANVKTSADAHMVFVLCHTRFRKGNRVHPICAPGSISAHTVDVTSEYLKQCINE
jgi:hypothetical protein